MSIKTPSGANGKTNCNYSSYSELMILPDDLYRILRQEVYESSDSTDCDSSSYGNIELAIKMRDDLEVYVFLTIPPEDYLWKADNGSCAFGIFF